MSELSEYDGTTVTLQVQEGKKPGEPIASYFVGTGKRSTSYLVFMPKTAPIGQNVRVVLRDYGRIDKRGYSLFTAYPAAPELSTRWKDNGDATISQVQISTDWLMVETEVEVLEIRCKEKKEGPPRTKDNFSVKWGTNLETTFLVNHQIKVYSLFEEEVVEGEVTWKMYGEREEAILPPITTPITSILTINPAWSYQKLQATFPPDTLLILSINWEGARYGLEYRQTWEAFPQWWKDKHDADYPVCTCNRQRHEKQADGYAKCEQCRKEEHCIRCNKQGTVKNFSGRLICSACEPYESAENLINTLISLQIRKDLAQQARLLLAVEPIERQVAHTILQSINRQDSKTFSQWIKTRDYSWYYFTEEGIFGSRFPRAALYVLSSLADASGNGFVEVMAWFHPGPNDYSTSTDFYTLTQVQGQQAKLPPMKDTLEKLAKLELGVAKLVRESEQQRMAAEEAANKAKEEAEQACLEAQKVEASFIQPVSLPEPQIQAVETVDVRNASNCIHQLREQLNAIQHARLTPNRVEVVFELGSTEELKAVSNWSGTVKARSGWKDIDGEVIFTCEVGVAQAGERWICQIKKCTGTDEKGRPNITVVPLVRSDQEEAIQAEIEQLRERLKDSQRLTTPSSTSTSVDDGEESPMAAAFRAAQTKKK